MYLGKIVEIADAVDIYARPGHPYTVALLEAVPEPDPTDRMRERVETRFHPATPLVNPPDPASPPSGCAFHPRCSFSTEECQHVLPPLQQVSALAPSHLVACHQVDKVLSSGPARRS